MIYAGDSSPDPEHTPRYSEAIEELAKLQFPSDIVAKACTNGPISCTEETPMKIFAVAFCALNIAMFFPSALYPQRATESPEFRVEIPSHWEKRPTCTVTNLSSKPVWALVLEHLSSSQPARKCKKVSGHALRKPPSH